jgi:hypothetical protein
MTSRRQFWQFFTGALVLGRQFLHAIERTPLTWTVQPEMNSGSQRSYRADAQVMLFGVTVLHRANVGDGSAAWRESLSDDGSVVQLLEFAGRSAPERAAGLNRFGFIQELSRSGEAIYFGVMTSSPEESAAEARQALHSTSKDAWYSAIDGRAGDEGMETARAHFRAPAHTSPAERQELIDRARQEIAKASKDKAPAPAARQPFLHALAGLLSDPRVNETHYLYNGRSYRLAMDRSRDAKMPGVIRVSGNLRRVEGGKTTEFRLWVEENATHPLPLRIEYQPKSYLKLTFESTT